VYGTPSHTHITDTPIFYHSSWHLLIQAKGEFYVCAPVLPLILSSPTAHNSTITSPEPQMTQHSIQQQYFKSQEAFLAATIDSSASFELCEQSAGNNDDELQTWGEL